jgi:hypothetical protein
VLQALGRALAGRADLIFEFGQPGCGWCFDPRRRAIVGDRLDAARPDRCWVLVAHEASHAAVTRYLFWRIHEHFALLLNVLEDCRIETWLMIRSPGLGEPLTQFNAEQLRLASLRCSQSPLSHQFGFGAIFEWFHGCLPDGLDPRVRAALEETADARRAYVGLQPPVRHNLAQEVAQRYQQSALACHCSREDPANPPSLFEKEVRLQAYAAFRLAATRVWPAYWRLVRVDRREGRLEDGANQTLCARTKPFLLPAPPAPGNRAFRLSFDYEDIGWTLRPRRRKPLTGGLALPAALEATGSHMPPGAGASEEAPFSYEGARRQVAPAVDRLRGELERRLRPARQPLWRSGFPTGGRLDLSRVMAFEADPRQASGFWKRPCMPSKPDPAILLLIDLSGSMRESGKIQNAFRGAVLLAETLAPLRIRFAIHGFQDELIRFKDFSTPLNPSTTRLLEEMPLEVFNRRSGGHNAAEYNDDGPCLRQAAAELLAEPGPERFLLVLSDGLPAGRGGAARSAQALRETVRWITFATSIHLIGLGLGDGTECVKDFYPNARVNIPVRDFPAALLALLDSILAR